jgi:hypothetical protein
MIAAKILGYSWIDRKKNPADVVSKHWGHKQVCIDFSCVTESNLDDGEEDIKVLNNNN